MDTERTPVTTRPKTPRVFLNSRSPLRAFLYCKTARGKWNPAYRVTEGTGWNYYRCAHKETPFSKPLDRPQMPSIVIGLMKAMELERKKELAAQDIHIEPIRVSEYRREETRQQEREVVRVSPHLLFTSKEIEHASNHHEEVEAHPPSRLHYFEITERGHAYESPQIVACILSTPAHREIIQFAAGERHDTIPIAVEEIKVHHGRIHQEHHQSAGHHQSWHYHEHAPGDSTRHDTTHHGYHHTGHHHSRDQTSNHPGHHHEGHHQRSASEHETFYYQFQQPWTAILIGMGGKTNKIRISDVPHAEHPPPSETRFSLHVDFPRRKTIQPKVIVADAFPPN